MRYTYIPVHNVSTDQLRQAKDANKNKSLIDEGNRLDTLSNKSNYLALGNVNRMSQYFLPLERMTASIVIEARETPQGTGFTYENVHSLLPPLSPEDLAGLKSTTSSRETLLESEQAVQIRKHLLHRVLQSTYPQAYREKFGSDDHFVKMPEMDYDYLNPKKTKFATLDPVPFYQDSKVKDLGSIIADDICVKQLKWPEGTDSFKSNYIQAVGSEQFTTQVRDIKMQPDHTSYPHSLEWLLPTSGLLDAKVESVNYMADLYMASKESHLAELNAAANSVLDYRQEKSQQPDDDRDAELAFHVFHGTMVFKLLNHFSEKSTTDAGSWFEKSSKEEALAAIDILVDKITNTFKRNNEDYIESMGCDFLERMEILLVMNYGIKFGSLTLIRDSIERLVFYLKREGNKYEKSVDELMNFKFFTNSAFVSKETSRALLANTLVNLEGKQDTFLETDRFFKDYIGTLGGKLSMPEEAEPYEPFAHEDQFDEVEEALLVPNLIIKNMKN